MFLFLSRQMVLLLVKMKGNVTHHIRLYAIFCCHECLYFGLIFIVRGRYATYQLRNEIDDIEEADLPRKRAQDAEVPKFHLKRFQMILA